MDIFNWFDFDLDVEKEKSRFEMTLEDWGKLNPLEKGFVWAFHNFSPATVIILGTFLLHELIYYGIYIPYAIADHIPAMNKYKIQKEKKNTFDIQLHCFFRLCFVHTFTQIPIMISTYHFLSKVGMERFPPFPPISLIALQIPFFYFVEDFWFYWIHRLLHWGPMYRWIHKVHHEHSAPFGIAAEYAHPLESFMLAIGTGIGPLMVGAHLFTMWIWLFFRVYQVVSVHSGYNFPWSPNHWIPLWGGAEFHDYHHKTFSGNYASTFTIWDHVFGTDKNYRLEKEAKRNGNCAGSPVSESFQSKELEHQENLQSQQTKSLKSE